MNDHERPDPPIEAPRGASDDNRPVPTVDISKLPDLPPGGSSAWGHSRRSIRWPIRLLGCFTIVLALVLAAAYLPLKKRVQKGFVDTCHRIETRILLGVGPLEKQRLITNIQLFRQHVEDLRDPNPTIGRFVTLARTALEDSVIDRAEARELSDFIESEISPPPEETPDQ